MEWCLDPARSDASALRREVREYLDRHADPSSDIDGAEVVVSEIVTNAIEHAEGPVWVALDWGQPQPVLTVQDLGPTFVLPPDTPDAGSAHGRGLFIAAALAEDLRVTARRSTGNKVRATLPVTRPVEASYSPAPRSLPSLPTPDEAGDDGFFHREAFLRALLLQLAQTVELDLGPETLERAVSQVGVDIGGRMEEEFRGVRRIDGPLSRDELVEFLIGLKAGIGGGFYLIDADDERIVLGNRACPFGDVVQRAPGLCRMTSSVFGSAAARLGGRSAVVLEERIAVGDPECKVVVWLREPSERENPVAHVYVGTPSRRTVN